MDRKIDEWDIQEPRNKKYEYMEVRRVTAGMANQWERMDQTISVSET